MMHLRFDLFRQSTTRPVRAYIGTRPDWSPPVEPSGGPPLKETHPVKVMAELGITYQHATPRSLGDDWIFWNCENVPDDLPVYIEEWHIDPQKAVGYGLSQELADRITQRMEELQCGQS